jgi:glycerate kinase
MRTGSSYGNMKILIAPNAFKGTLGPVAAARAMERAFRAIVPGAALELIPVSDGGDGLLESLINKGSDPFFSKTLFTAGPLLKPVRARWALAGDIAVIEMAEAAGIKHLSKKELAPLDATTFGVGRLMRAAVLSGARTIIVGLGGSASNDGGAGCAAGFGLRLLDQAGGPVPPGARGLLKLEKILPPCDERLASTRIKVVGLTDVDNPLCGPRGSALVYGPQKGAGAGEVAVMERALIHYARVVKRELGRDVMHLKGGAAAGGLGAGLCAFFDAKLVRGSDFVLRRLNFEAALKQCDFVVTGEGRLDDQSFSGKAPIAVSRLARRHNKPVLLVCGSCTVESRRRLRANGVGAVIALDKVLSRRELADSPARNLTRALLLSKSAITLFLCH